MCDEPTTQVVFVYRGRLHSILSLLNEHVPGWEQNRSLNLVNPNQYATLIQPTLVVIDDVHTLPEGNCLWVRMAEEQKVKLVLLEH